MLIPLAAALILAAAGEAAAQKNKCADWPLEVSITPVVGGVLFGDSKGVTYRNGVDGVGNTVIHICSGSYDATVGLNGSRRHMGFDFSSFIADANASWPTWTDDQFLTKPFMNVRNVLWGRKNLPAVDGTFTFETRMSIGYIKGAGDRSDYVLRFFPTAVSPGPGVTPAAPPFDDATVPVLVVDNPATCTWTVTVPPDYVGGLYKTSTDAFAGHYHMPFQLTLRATAGCTPQ